MEGDPNVVAVPRATLDAHAKATALLERLLQDPKTARGAEDLIRQINPEAKFPARDLADSYAEPIKAQAAEARKAAEEAKAELAAWKNEQAEAKRISEMQDRFSKATDKYGFDDKLQQAVLERMKTQNSPDVEAAAAWVAEQQPKAPPVNGRTSDFLPQKVDLYGSVSRDEQYKKLHDNPQQFFDDEVRAVLADPALAA